jgi:hypothetical protein
LLPEKALLEKSFPRKALPRKALLMNYHGLRLRAILYAAVAITLLSGCMSSEGRDIPTQDATQFFEDALLTATFAVQESVATSTPNIFPTGEPSSTPEASLTPTQTPYTGPPPVLPAIFSSNLLGAGSSPVTYIGDECQYLKARLDPNSSPPGTVVMAVMFHGIGDDSRVINDNMDVHHSDMVEFLEHAHELGFETVTTQEIVAFMEENARIPARSLYIVLDDRRPGGVRQHFMPYLEKFDWTLTLGWLIGDTDTRPASYLDCCPEENFSMLWEQMEAYNATGYLDVQSHGNIHNINISNLSTDEFILSELNESRRLIREHFYCKDYATGQPILDCQTDQPLAFIWPGGGFTAHAVELARDNGYKLGFTTNPRGPILYNWVPQAMEYDPGMPSWIAEGPANDPLMTLPRYWSYDAVYRIDDVAELGEQASVYAATHRKEELDYYSYYCRESSGEIPALGAVPLD